MVPIDLSAVNRLLTTRFGGVLHAGAHPAGDEACALEFWSQLEGAQWTNDPATLNLPDLRPINDGPWSSDAARAEALLPVLVAVAPVWRDPTLRPRWLACMVVHTVRELLPPVLRAAGLLIEATCCAGVQDLAAAVPAATAAAVATRAAWNATAASTETGAAAAQATRAAAVATRAAWAETAATRAAWAETEATRAASMAASRAAWALVVDHLGENHILRAACRLWIEAAEEVQQEEQP